MPATLCAALMVRNEEKHLNRCLFSLLDVVSEIVVVDTGSTDATVEIAKKYTSKVYHEPWCDNFSTHRNQSFSHATTDWIMQIDADEELLYTNPNSAELFLKVLSSLPPKINAVTFMMRDWRESQNKYVADFDVVRCFRKGKVKYRRRVHNDPVFEGETVVFPYIVFKHYGYDLNEEQKAAKAKRTIGLLERELQENPQDYECHFYKMQAYGAWTKDWKKAIQCATEYIKHEQALGKKFNKTVFYSAASILMTQDKLDEAEEWLKKGILHDRQYPDLDISWAMIQLGLKKKAPDIIAQGARGYVMAYEDPKGARQRNPGQFFFNRSPDCYAIALYYKALSFIEYGVIELKKLNDYLEKAEVKKEVAADLRQQIGKDFSTLGLSSESLVKNGKRLIITPSEYRNPLFQKTGRITTLS